MNARDIHARQRTIWTAITAGFCLAGAMALGGCAGDGGAGAPGGITISPEYRPSAQTASAVDGKRQPVSVKVVDARTDKGRMGKNGKEVLAEGDKGVVYTDKPVAKAMEDALAASLSRSGFSVTPNAPVVVEVSLIDLPVQAYQFTHWNLPSERASTLDALGALVPGPVRETAAKVSASVAVRKLDARLGLSHVVTADAVNKSSEGAIVGQTLSEAISRAADDAVAKAGPDVELISRTPVSAREIFDKQEEFVRQQKAIADLSAMVAQRDAMVAEDRKALDDMKRQLEDDRRKAQENAAADRAKVEQQKTALQTERDALKTQLEKAQQTVTEVAAKPVADPAADAAAKKQVADLQAQQAMLEQRKIALDQSAAEVEARTKTLADREQNLAAYSEKLKAQAGANQVFADDLAARQKEIASREKALTNWKNDLDAKTATKAPVALVEKRRPLILVTDPAAGRTETTLGTVTVSGLAIDDRKVSDLKVTVNGQPVSDLMPVTTGSKGVGLRSVGGPVTTAQEGPGAYAMRRFNFVAGLREGANEIIIEAANEDRLKATEKLSVLYDKGGGRIHIITIGINDYQNKSTVPPLQYAVSDAKSVASTFGKMLSVPSGQMVSLLDGEATKANLDRALFQKLPSEVKPADTVVIYFSGHGAPDTATDAAGNVETYLLPIDADPAKLLSTAIRMSDVGTILRRLRSERIVFLADTCYSGAAGKVGENATAMAKTVSIPGGVALKGGVGLRSVPDRPQGKGCAILTASTGIQVAQEKTEYGHGVFTHFLIEGLQGKADGDHNGSVTVDELYEYLKTNVGDATDKKQTPQMSRDASAGDIVLSNVKK